MDHAESAEIEQMHDCCIMIQSKYEQCHYTAPHTSSLIHDQQLICKLATRVSESLDHFTPY